ncbi:hypothetical protein E2C01_042591 [Portunus trituberculatus]|uniref:Uncharacterized protein n=1 Tax=Portunus trituberculatus TaxID=210409 RepID=A0A5B7FV82_PORTR|nr:hypothetical protein [Portunus trituberculatus]
MFRSSVIPPTQDKLVLTLEYCRLFTTPRQHRGSFKKRRRHLDQKQEEEEEEEEYQVEEEEEDDNDDDNNDDRNTW